MQIPDEKKRLKILTTAATLFASQPFHRVRLSDVAQKAGVGKGTLYTYFKNKDDLYLSVFFIGFFRLVDQLEKRTAQGRSNPEEKLSAVIDEMIGFAFQHPHLFEVMRRKGTGYTKEQIIKRDNKRNQLKKIIENIIEEGNSVGIFHDSKPGLTAWIIQGMVRSAIHQSDDQMDKKELTGHLCRFILNSLKYDRN